MRSTFENAFTYAPIGMALVDMAGRLLRVNDALCRITGYTSEEICTRTFYDLSDPHDADVDARVVEGPRQQNHGDIAHDQRIVHQARILGGPEDRPIARFDIDRVDTLDFVPGDQDLLDQGNPVMDAIGRKCE